MPLFLAKSNGAMRHATRGRITDDAGQEGDRSLLLIKTAEHDTRGIVRGRQFAFSRGALEKFSEPQAAPRQWLRTRGAGTPSRLP